MADINPVYSANTVLAHLNTLLDDSGDSRWTATEKAYALIYACQRAWPEWFDLWINESMTYDKDVNQYALYDGMLDLVAVHIITASETRNITDWYVRGRYLYIPTAYSSLDGGTLRLTAVTQPSPLVNMSYSDGSSGIVVTANTKQVVFPSGALLQSKGVQPGMTIHLGGGTGGLSYTDYHVDRVTDETALYLIESPTTDSVHVGVEIGTKTDLPVAYLAHMAAAYLLQHEGSPANNVDVEKTLQWARFHYETALMELRRWKKRYPPRR